MKAPEYRKVKGWNIALIAAFVVLLARCGGQPTPGVVAGIDGCSSCGMVIDRVNQAAGWIEGGDFVTFCSPGCLLAERDARRKSGQPPPQAVYFADYRDGSFLQGSETTFLLTDHVPTVMDARVICFGSVAAAEEMRQHTDEMVTDWTGYRVFRGQPDSVVEVVVGPGGMDPEVVTANKGDIVLWRVRGDGLEEDLRWTIRGYPEVDPPIVAASGEATEIRFLATRPGTGFPIEDATTGEALGMLKVGGAHTADEAAQ